MIVTNRQPSEKALKLSTKILERAKNPQIVADIALLLTLFVHQYIKDTEGIEATKKALDDWIQVIKLDVEYFVLNE